MALVAGSRITNFQLESFQIHGDASNVNPHLIRGIHHRRWFIMHKWQFENDFGELDLDFDLLLLDANRLITTISITS